MKSTKLLLLMPLLFSFSLGYAQEKLTKEEKARREKNIQAGNPFARFGYKAKVATLSKGKYLEVHDLDSIVVIGSIRWHVDKQQIFDDVKIDSTDTDRQPTGDIPGMWMSPDPLSEEFPDWSPYNFCFSNPMRFVDPDGKAPDDWRNALGQQVYDPKANGGQGAYTKYATATERQFGDALRNSGTTGAESFNYLVSAKTQDIEINFLTTDASSEGLGYLFGFTENKYNTDSNGNVTEITSSKIDIYMGTSETFVKDAKNNTLLPVDMNNDTKSDVKAIKDGKLDANKITTSVIGHELKHTTTTNQQQMNDSQSGAKNFKKQADSEYVPNKTQNQIQKDLENK